MDIKINLIILNVIFCTTYREYKISNVYNIYNVYNVLENGILRINGRFVVLGFDYKCLSLLVLDVISFKFYCWDTLSYITLYL